MKRKLIILLTLYILFKIFLNYQIIQTSIYHISLIFFKNIFPALFIFFIISSILINYGFVNIIAKLFGKFFCLVFGINSYQTYILIMSMLSGLPSNAKYINEMLDNNLITIKEANRIILFSHFANPLFILFIGLNKPHLILIAHYLPNFIIGLFTREKIEYKKEQTIKTSNKNFVDILSTSIISSFNILLSVLGLIIIFYTLSSLSNFFILKYILEMSSSITYIVELNTIEKIKAMLVTGILSFGGISVHMQVFAILNKKKIRYLPYLLARLTHFMLSTLIIYFIY